MKRRVTKAAAVREFLGVWRQFERSNPNAKTDRIMKIEAFGVFVDSLNKSGMITDSQASRWTNPFEYRKQ